MTFPPPHPARFVASPRGPVVAAVLLAAGSALVVWMILSTAASGEMDPAPGDPAWLGAVPYVIAGGAGLFGLWALACIPAALRHRFEIGQEGIRWRAVELPWERVQAVRILVLSTTKPLAVSVAPRSVRTSARLSLEVSLREPELAEAHQPVLRSRRIPGTATEGYTHHFPLGPGALLTGTDPAQFAPAVQAVLAQVAAPIYYGVTIRQTATTWTRGRA